MQFLQLSLLAVFLATPSLPQDPAVRGGGESVDDPDLVARARAIHERVVTLDTHKDIPTDFASVEVPESPDERERFLDRTDPSRWGTAQVDFPKMRAGGLDCAFFIVYVPQGPLTAEGFARAREQALARFEAIHRMARRFPDDIEIALTPDDVGRIAAAGKLVACIGIENGFAMGDDPAAVAEFHRLGARYMSLTHNGHSQLGDSNTPEEPIHGGLTELGERAIEEMNRHGILVDVSHAGKRTMLDALAVSRAPVIASHSSCAAVRPHSRNLDDEQLLALKENGGVIQMVAFDAYVVDDSERRGEIVALREELDLPRRWRGQPTDTSPEAAEKRRVFRERVAEIEARHPPADVADFVDHIDHAVALIGVEHVAISSDFDGGGGIVGWKDASETFAVTLELVQRGYSEAEIERIWSGNTLRIWREVEASAARIREEEGR